MLTNDPWWRVLNPGVETPDRETLGRVEEYAAPTGPFPVVNIPAPALPALPQAPVLAPQAQAPIVDAQQTWAAFGGAQAPYGMQQQHASAPAPTLQGQDTASAENRWMGVFDRLAQPDVLGPLQTFLASMTVPLRPGETMASRMAYSGMLMNIHRTMLQERADQAPLERRKAEADIARGEAEARRLGVSADVAEGTVDDEIRLAKEKIRNLVLEGNKTAVETTLAETKAYIMDRYGYEAANRENAKLEAETARLWRDAKAPYPTTGAARTKDMTIQTARYLYSGAVKAYEAARKAGEFRDSPDMTFDLWVGDPLSPYVDNASDVLAAKSMLEYAGELPYGGSGSNTPSGPVRKSYK